MWIYNTQTRKKEEFQPLHEGKVGIYACGPTVYNYIHIGNARPLIVFDVLRRYLEWRGYDVTFVQTSGHRRQDDQPRQRGGHHRQGAGRALHRRVFPGRGGPGRAPGHRPPQGHGAHPRDHRPGAEAHGQGPGPTRARTASTSTPRPSAARSTPAKRSIGRRLASPNPRI